MKTITSADNPFYKHLRKLSESGRERRKTGETLLDGVHLVQACLQAGVRLLSMVVSVGAEGDPEIAALLRQVPAESVVQLAEGLFREVSPVATPTGVLALIPIPRPKTESNDFCVLLEDIQDPGNLGSILRSAAAAGARSVFLSHKCADAWAPKVLRAAMGAHFQLALHEHADLAQVMGEFPGKVVATGLAGKHSLFDADLRGAVAFVFGNEGAGLSQTLLAAATEVVRIPMPGGSESLNAAAAAAVCLFERVRQQGA